MQIVREETKTITSDVVTGYKCDWCEREIPKDDSLPHYEITTGHREWGADSYESIEREDACSLSCCIQLIAGNKSKEYDTFYFEICGNAAAARAQ